MKAGWWIWDGHRLAKIKRAYCDDEPLYDLVMYSTDGERLGRVSPPMGGPRTFEPACSGAGYRRIKKPTFPMKLVRCDDGIVRYYVEFA